MEQKALKVQKDLRDHKGLLVMMELKVLKVLRVFKVQPVIMD